MPYELRESFEHRVQITPGCWIWNGIKDYKGYGIFLRKGVRKFAHRLSYELYVGEIPAGLCICHKCDNPKCVNPEHLWAGTNKDNVDDKMRKGRWRGGPARTGELHPLVKLTDELVYSIRADDRPITRIAAAYGLSQSHVTSIKRRARWSHLPERGDEKESVDGRGHKPKLTIEQQLRIRSDDRVQTVIAAEYGVSQAVISKIKLGGGCYASLK